MEREEREELKRKLSKFRCLMGSEYETSVAELIGDLEWWERVYKDLDTITPILLEIAKEKETIVSASIDVLEFYSRDSTYIFEGEVPPIFKDLGKKAKNLLEQIKENEDN